MNYEDKFEFGPLTVIRSSYACPEAYSVYYENNQIGYLRLRHGIFRVDYYPLQLHKIGVEDSRETIYEACAMADGIFDDYERNVTVTMALGLLRMKLDEEKKELDQNKSTQGGQGK
jgi:hypothetical protein